MFHVFLEDTLVRGEFWFSAVHSQNKLNDQSFSQFSPVYPKKTWNIGTKLFSAL